MIAIVDYGMGNIRSVEKGFMTNVLYTCRMCHKQGMTSYDEVGAKFLNIETWLPKVMCERCADYSKKLHKTTDYILNRCFKLQQVRSMWDAQRAERVTAEGEIRQQLNQATQRFAHIVCDFYHLQMIWESDFIEQLMEQPAKSGLILNVYRRRVGKLAKEA